MAMNVEAEIRDRHAPLCEDDDLKQRIRYAIRKAIQEHADELGISYDACLEWLAARADCEQTSR